MDKGEYQYPQMTYKQAVEHCKYWVDQIRHDGLDLLTTDYGAAIGVSDQLAYPLEMQTWINSREYPLLYKVCVYSVTVDNDHTDRVSWKKLLELMDRLANIANSNYCAWGYFKQVKEYIVHDRNWFGCLI